MKCDRIKCTVRSAGYCKVHVCVLSERALPLLHRLYSCAHFSHFSRCHPMRVLHDKRYAAISLVCGRVQIALACNSLTKTPIKQIGSQESSWTARKWKNATKKIDRAKIGRATLISGRCNNKRANQIGQTIEGIFREYCNICASLMYTLYECERDITSNRVDSRHINERGVERSEKTQTNERIRIKWSNE